MLIIKLSEDEQILIENALFKAYDLDIFEDADKLYNRIKRD